MCLSVNTNLKKDVVCGCRAMHTLSIWFVGRQSSSQSLIGVACHPTRLWVAKEGGRRLTQ